MTDYRTRSGIEAEILAEVSINRELSVTWIEAKRNRPAALKRLLDSGKLHQMPCKHPSVLRFGVEKESLAKRLFGRWLS